MIILLNLGEGRVTLDDPANFGQFSVRVDDGRSPEAIRQLVESSGLGTLHHDQEHVVVDPAAVRRLAGSVVDDDWEQGFSAMCTYAASKGWLEDGGILAHIE
ncbi:MAG TPA: hypothetical protein VGH31_07235 [Acidimicrobiales bacterium]|jgi:hypothetical protein